MKHKTISLMFVKSRYMRVLTKIIWKCSFKYNQVVDYSLMLCPTLLGSTGWEVANTIDDG